jgi:hypothetical protein
MMTKLRFSTLLMVTAALVVLFVWDAGGQGAKPVQMWDYKSLVMTVGPGPVALYEDGKPASGTPVSRIPELGQQGWELVTMTAVAPAGGGLQYAYWFKRPK